LAFIGTLESVALVWPFEKELANGWVVRRLLPVKALSIRSLHLKGLAQNRVEGDTRTDKSCPAVLTSHIVADDPLETLKGALCFRRVQQVGRAEARAVCVHLQMSLVDVKLCGRRELKSIGKLPLQKRLPRIVKESFERIRD